MSEAKYTRDDLYNLPKRFDTFVGIDSDGCVFDTMEVKQKDHFHPQIIKSWELEAIEPQLRQAAEFFNLYSHWRGQNRFIALRLVFEALPEIPGVIESGVALPPTAALKAYLESGLPLGNPSLAKEAERTGDAELKRVLDWSLAVNRDIDENMPEILAFPASVEAIEKIQGSSDVIVVSQTPEEALVKEWERADLTKHIEVIAGQELGTKGEHLAMATEGRWEGHRILMIGDAPGDRKAAEAVNALFYPILPGRENEAWERLRHEAYDRFLAGDYAGSYEDELIAEFEAMLPKEYPWLK